ncbi:MULTISPECIES: adenylyltransferase/cytidyltransferase family protein [Salinibaculum]|uniref:adenylyltransferase/cytidyltransferase family protein n=1 Tax=Salinibaculum TaxID=2732368 RepID=UPI0030CEFD3F
MKRVVAQGTFDILHPGHVHYLSEAAAMGDELHVIVARADNVTHKPKPVIPSDQRVEMVEALDPVDHARPGHPDDIFVPIEDIEPAVIVLGHDQHHDPDAIRQALAERDIDCEVVRASAREAAEGEEFLSTGRIIEKILRERGR